MIVNHYGYISITACCDLATKPPFLARICKISVLLSTQDVLTALANWNATVASPTCKAASASADSHALACPNVSLVSLCNNNCLTTSENPLNSVLTSIMQPLCNSDKAPFLPTSVAQETKASSTRCILAYSHGQESSASQSSDCINLAPAAQPSASATPMRMRKTPMRSST
jgi:hypothetical protein